MIELYVGIELDELLYSTHLMIIGNTNPAEAGEFLESFVHHEYIIVVSSLLILAVISYLVLKHFRDKFRYHRGVNVILSFLGIGSVAIMAYLGLFSATALGRMYRSIVGLTTFITYDLHTSQAPASVHKSDEFHPNIILIMGESFDRLHSSIYGYDKLTNPKLDSLVADSALIVFNNVSSSASSTALSFHLMFTTAEKMGDPDWYKKELLPTALKNGGYRTSWISNQTALSVVDNALGQIAELCDYRDFVADRNINQKRRFDELLFAPADSAFSSISDSREFVMLHLSGSHATYSKRYPQDWNKFSPDDYPEKPEHQRFQYATYDNSILYNDYVVSHLIKAADDLDAIIIYTSDHGQDFYYTRPNYHGHGSPSNPASLEAGCRIPFFVYLTPSFRNKHPEYETKIRSAVDRKFYTKDLFYTILDLAGLELDDKPNHGHSLFSQP